MTTTDTPLAPAPPIAPAVHDEALDLIRALAAAAGNGDAVFEELRKFCSTGPKDDVAPRLAAALFVTFTECITYPTASGDFAPVEFPDAYDSHHEE